MRTVLGLMDASLKTSLKTKNMRWECPFSGQSELFSWKSLLIPVRMGASGFDPENEDVFCLPFGFGP